MIDFHSHVLPNVDDGSRSVEESIQLLKMLAKQGATTVCATPHFVAVDESPDAFFEKRQKALDRLLPHLTDDMPKIRVGAEVLYYSGISKLEGLSRFCIEGTRFLLLEMPFSVWNEHIVREVLELSRSGEFHLILAHVERYLPDMPRDLFKQLLEYDVIMQSNASFFLGFLSKYKALKMMRDGEIHLIGSDCHNMRSRQPRLDEARAVIIRRLGEEFLEFYDERAERFLGVM